MQPLCVYTDFSRNPAGIITARKLESLIIQKKGSDLRLTHAVCLSVGSGQSFVDKSVKAKKYF